MSESFYNYLVKELILGFFKSNPFKKGSRFFLIIENETHRDGLMKALENNSEPITLSGIYGGDETNVSEETYETRVLRTSTDSPGLILGYDKTATEDYLTTIRNSVGVDGGKYEYYGVLFVLSDNTSSILSSLNTTVMDLQSIGGPLNSRNIIKSIETKAKDVIVKDYEMTYLTLHLSKISEYISDGTCNLFDFKHALTVLSDATLKGHFNELDFFPDKTIYDHTFHPENAEMEQRVKRNHELYRKVCDVMNQDDDIDKFATLQKFLDEKLSKKLLVTEDWKQIDFQEFLNSLERKAITAELELVDISLPSEGFLTSLIYTSKGNRKKKTTNSIIICDQSEAIEQIVAISFNKDLKKIASNICKVYGNVANITVKDELIKQTIGVNDNHHDFFILKLPCEKELFKDIHNCFSINKKGEIVVVVPEEADVLSFGKGAVPASIPLDGIVEWSSDMTLTVPVIAEDENEQIQFTIKFGEKPVKFVLKLHTATSIPPVGPESFPPTDTIFTGVPTDKGPFGKISNGETERGVFGYWRQYLEWEKAFIDNGCSYIEYVTNDITKEYTANYLDNKLPFAVKESLSRLYNYFKDNNTVPSLCPMTDEVKPLYVAYWDAIKNSINAIQGNRGLTREEYNLTKLGIVSQWNRIYLSPFHPINVAFRLEYNAQYDTKEDSSFAKKLLSPFYLIPYLYFNDLEMRPYSDCQLSEIKTWLSYEGVNSKPQERTNDITTKMVWTKMEAFIRHFNYLFQDKDCPITISTIGIPDDTNVIKGIIEFIKHQYVNGVQKIELHEYVDNIMEETFFEKLNRLDSIDSITRELQSIKVNIESKGDYTNQEIIHQLFTRVSFYKHSLEACDNNIGYCHIAFYQMDTGTSFIKPNTDDARTELAFNGLISIPSTINKEDVYVIGFGTKGVTSTDGYIFPMAIAMNNLYANEENEGGSIYRDHTCVAKKYKFSQSTLLNSIYDNANWVTFINPEVDINFFYKQNLYVVHYTDQYTINAKYDSITVTKHVKQYENMLRKSYEKYSLSEERFLHFNETMMDYFNCLNGSWMLDIVNKTESQIREKMSIVAASISMLRFMRRNANVRWIPVSLEEILRVTGSIGLPQDYIFTKKDLGAKGAMSDDLLMIGLDSSEEKLKLYLYPVEVKFSKNNSFAEKGGKQVAQTYCQLKEHLFGEGNFTKNIYRTFFASQFLTNAEKLNANNLLSNEEYSEIEKHRHALLNLGYSIQEMVPFKEMGCAAVVSFFSTAAHEISTSCVDGVPVCSIHFSEPECFQFVAEPENNHLDFLETGTIQVDPEAKTLIDNPAIIAHKEEADGVEVELFAIEDEISETETTDGTSSTSENNEETVSHKQAEVQTSTTEEPNTSSPQSIRILVGQTLSTKRDVVFEPNNTKMVSHPNMGVIGTMGTGKTQFARSLIAQFSKEAIHNVGGKPVGILVFDYKGDYKDDEFLSAVNGTCYKFNYPFNPLKLVVNDQVEGMNLPAITADRIADSFAKAYGLGLKQQSNIKQVIIETYADAGITREPATWNNPVPTMEQVIEKYFDTYDANDKAFALFDKLRDYTIFTTDNNNCVSLFEWLDSVRVIDLTLYPDDTKKVIVSLILDLFYAEMRQLGGSRQENGFRELRAMIMVDEAHQFLKKDFNSFRSIISEGRMFGVGMILSTQNISDFKTSKEDYSQFVLSWIIHHVNSISKSEIASIFGASDSNGDKYMDFINKAKLFESVCKIGSRVEGIRDEPFFELIQNDERFSKES